MKRAHVKGRNGCVQCKQRRVRCDEAKPECFNCKRLRQRGRGAACSFQSRQLDAQLARSDSDGSMIDEISPVLNMCPDVANTDWFYISHVERDATTVQTCEQYKALLGFGAGSFPRILELAREHECVFYSVCGLGSLHMSLLTRSSIAVSKAHEYRSLSLRSLITLINEDTAGKNLEAVLAASLLLSWSAPEKHEFSATMQGVMTTLMQMDKIGHKSPLSALFDSHTAALTDYTLSSAVIIPDETKKELLKTAFVSLKAFAKVAKHKDDEEMLAAVKHLQCVLRNAESLSNSFSMNELFETLFPLRMWLHVIPRGVFRLLKPDPMILIFMAHYEMVRLVSELAMPAIHVPFNHDGRARCIKSIGQELFEFEETAFSENEDYRQLCFKAIKGPMACASEYLKLRSLNAHGLPQLGLLPDVPTYEMDADLAEDVD